MTDKPTNPETIIIPPRPKDAQPLVKKHSKKKGGKGMLISILLFFILTLPVAIYYGSQKYTQITEQRGRASGEQCRQINTVTGRCVEITCTATTNEAVCRNTKSNGVSGESCCAWNLQVGSYVPPVIGGSDSIHCPSGQEVLNGDFVGRLGGCGAVNCQMNQSMRATCIYRNQCAYPDDLATCSNGTLTEYNSCAFDYGCEIQPTNTPNPTATTAPLATNTPTIQPTATTAPVIVNTNAPGVCDASCDTDSNCESGLSCQTVTGIKRCRKSACPDRSNCECPIAEATTTLTPYNPPIEGAGGMGGGEITYIPQPTERVIAEEIPVTGSIDIKAIIITIGSILLLALGLIL